MNGCLVLIDSFVCFECVYYVSFDGGDYIIIVGCVLWVVFEIGCDVLGFFGGKVGWFVVLME